MGFISRTILTVSPLSGVYDEYDDTHIRSLLRMSQLLNPLYRELGNSSNTVRTRADLYEALNKPEKAKQWRAKLPQAENLTN